jgi:hypothetical protein
MENDFSPFGTDLFGEPIKQETPGVVAQKFTLPPFSILNTREGAWQERKAAWLSLGIKSEEGRGEDVTFHQESLQRIIDEKRSGRAANAIPGGSAVVSGYGPDGERLTGGVGALSGTSIFDPVLCELCYEWFTAPGQQVLDPCAGGSVRGIIASLMGRRYWGGELRPEQVAANREQALKLCGAESAHAHPQWVEGDSLETAPTAPEADFVFSCPPYGDLEVYSDDPRDLSRMTHDDFLTVYYAIIRASVARLKPDRFACFVVGDFRDRHGFYRDFVSDTISAFRCAGAKLYNEAILVNCVASAALRVTRQFNAGRKLVKTHQYVLVFCKGDWHKATEAAGGSFE